MCNQCRKYLRTYRINKRKKENNYKNGKIYKICSPNTDKIYIGSTIVPLNTRFREHKKKTNKTVSYEIINSGGAYIELIENYPCDNKKELERREGYYQKLNLDFIVNKKIAKRTRNEYRKDNAEKIKEISINYYQKNKNRILERQSKQIICECGVTSTITHFKRHCRTKYHNDYINGNWIFKIEY
jgi:hypothetical protein